MIRTAAAALALALAAPAAVAPAPAAVLIRNAAAGALVCELTLAHWFVERHGPAAPGEALTLPLRFDRSGEIVSVLNGRGEEMAVEGLVCGIAGRVQATAARPAFRPLAGAAAGRAVVLTCAEDGGSEGRLACAEGE